MTSASSTVSKSNSTSARKLFDSAKPTLLAVATAGLIAAALLLLSGVAPHTGFESLFSGGLGSQRAIEATVLGAVPLILMALGLSVAYTSRFWTIGAEGQFVLGALASAAVVLKLPTGPAVTSIALMLIAGALVGALVGFVPGVLRANYGINEVVTSLLLNFIAAFLLGYLVRKPLRSETSFQPRTASIPDKAVLPQLFGTRIDISIFLVVGLMVLTSYLLGATPLGVRLRMIGLNPTAANAMGVRTASLTIFLGLFSGATAGLAGAVQVAGQARFVNALISPGLGFTAIIVALLGRLHYGGVLIAGLAISALSVGGTRLQTDHEVSASLVTVVQAVLVLAMLAAGRKQREMVRS